MIAQPFTRDCPQYRPDQGRLAAGVGSLEKKAVPIEFQSEHRPIVGVYTSEAFRLDHVQTPRAGDSARCRVGRLLSGWIILSRMGIG